MQKSFLIYQKEKYIKALIKYISKSKLSKETQLNLANKMKLLDKNDIMSLEELNSCVNEFKKLYDDGIICVDCLNNSINLLLKISCIPIIRGK